MTRADRTMGDRRMRKIIPGIALAVSISSSSAGAQTMDYGSLASLFGESVTTSATGSPQKASDAPVPLEIITADDIKRSGASNIATIVSRVAGVNVVQGSGQDYSVSVRGYNEPLTGRLLVLVNGRQVYLDFFGFTDWAALPVRLEEIRQIEVVKGPNTALFGFNAAAGVINIVTFNPGYDPVSTATVRGGTQGALEASAAATYKISEGNGIRVSGGYTKIDEFDTHPAQILVTTGVLNKKSPFNYTAAGEGIFKLGADTQLMAEASTSRHDYNIFTSPAYNVQQANIKTESYRGEIVSNTGIGLLTGRVYQNKTSADTQKGLPIDAGLVVLQGQDLFKVGANTTFRLSGEWRTNSMKSTPDQTGEVSYDVFSGGIMGEQKLSADYTLTGAVRFDSLKMQRTGTFDLGVPQKNSLWDRTIEEVSYNFGLVGRIGAEHSLRLTTARGLALPSLFNLAVQSVPAPAPAPVYTGAVVLGNPNLNATVVTNYELGWDWTMSETSKLTASLFYQQNENFTAISNFNVVPPDYLVSRPPFPALLVADAEPYGNSDVTGFEASYKNTLPSGLSWGLNGALLEVRDKLSTRVPRRIAYEKSTPEFEFNVQAGWASGSWVIDAYLKYVSETYSFKNARASNVGGATVIGLLPVDAYVNLDLRVAYLLSKGVTLAIEGRNLVDDGSIRSGGLKVPTQVIGTLRFDF